MRYMLIQGRRASAPPTAYTDDFNRADEYPLAGNWTRPYEFHETSEVPVNLVDKKMQQSTSVWGWNVSIMRETTWPTVANAKITAGVGGTGSMSYAGLVGRANAEMDTYYRVQQNMSDTSISLLKYVDGVWSSLGSLSSCSGSVLGLRCNGTSIAALMDGEAVLEVTDASIPDAGFFGPHLQTNYGSTVWMTPVTMEVL